jgi:hypothetical protein
VINPYFIKMEVTKCYKGRQTMSSQIGEKPIVEGHLVTKGTQEEIT